MCCSSSVSATTAAATGTTGAYVSAISTTTLTVTGSNLPGASYYGQSIDGALMVINRVD